VITSTEYAAIFLRYHSSITLAQHAGLLASEICPIVFCVTQLRD